MPPNNRQQRYFRQRTSVGARAAGVTRPTPSPPAQPSQLKPSPPLPLEHPQPGHRGGGLPNDSCPDQTNGAAGPESTMRNCVCCEFVILPAGSLQGLPWVGDQQPLIPLPVGTPAPCTPTHLFVLIRDSRGRTGLKGQQN